MWYTNVSSRRKTLTRAETMWADNETNEDFLGFQVHADLIKSLVLDGNLLPITIGVFADWGGGKTSIMKIIEKSFTSENSEDLKEKDSDGVLCLYFNGWLFEGYDDAKSALLSSVIMSLGEHKRFGPKVKDTCVSLLRSVNWLRVAYLGAKNVSIPAIAAYASGGATIVPQILGWASAKTNPLASETVGNNEGEQHKKNIHDNEPERIDWETLIKNDSSPQNPLGIRDFREQFGRMLAKSDIKTLVVLIDDLDRCSPERIVENLEAIKLFLNVERTAFIIGADPRIVRHAIELKYGLRSGENSNESAYNTIVNDYLEKLIQYPYYLPKLSPVEIETYISLLFAKKYLSVEGFRAILSEYKNARTNYRFNSFGEHAITSVLSTIQSETETQKLHESLAITSIISPLITECLKGNPRQVKRFLNLFELRKKMSEIAHLNIRNDVLVKLMILEYSHPEQYEQLYQWQVENEGKPEILEILEKDNMLQPLKEVPVITDENLEESGKKKGIDKTRKTSSISNSQTHDIPNGWKKEGIKKWLQTEPPLVNIDLRNYFWLTRDRLQSTLAGMVLVSPLIRSCLRKLLNGGKGKRLIAEISNMQSGDQQSLCSLIRKEICNKPNESHGYKALGVLIDNSIDLAAEELLYVFKSVPVESIPAPIGMMVLLHAKSLGIQIPVLKEIEKILQNNPETNAGKAYLSK